MASVRVPSRVAVPAVVLMIAAVLRLWGLPSPPSLYWDEQYYVFDAEVYLGGGIGQPIGNRPPVKIATKARGSPSARQMDHRAAGRRALWA